MKYGVLFLALGVLLAWIAIQKGDFYWILFWPATSLLIVAIAYLFQCVKLFGKRTDGSMNPLAILLLLPYLAFLWAVWHLLRVAQTENPHDSVDERTLIGRRLLGRERPDVQSVVDLTCEFPESKRIVENTFYLSFPILDASVTGLAELHTLVKKIDSLVGVTYIHCAQGHGRTGLVTAALLLHRNPKLTVQRAIEQLQEVRPALRCNREQIASLRRFQKSVV